MGRRVKKIKGVEMRLGDSSRVMSGLADESVDLVMCDPPYGTTKHPWDIPPNLKGLLNEFDRLLVKGGRIIFFSAHPFTAAVAAALTEAGWASYELVWVKNQGSQQLNCGWRPLQTHETIFVCYRKGEAKAGHYQPQTTPGKPYKKRRALKGAGYGSQREHMAYNEGIRQPTTVLHFQNPRKKGDHPTAKPVDLLSYLIRQYSAPGGTVLDPFMGGGNSAVAAMNEGRNYLGVEINEGYVTLARSKLRAK